jgi:hypothetical protein
MPKFAQDITDAQAKFAAQLCSDVFFLSESNVADYSTKQPIHFKRYLSALYML